MANGQTTSLAKQIHNLLSEILVEVRLQSGLKERGHLAERTANGFELKPVNAARGNQHSIAFGEVQSIRKIEKTHTPIAAWIAFGAIVGVVVVAVAAYLVFRSNA